MHLVICI